MIHWQGDGIILGHKSFGEQKAIVSLLTKEHGRIAGVIRLTKALRLQGTLESGTQVEFQWKARLEAHLGTLSLEVAQSMMGHVLGNSTKLLALNAATLLLHELCPERHPYPVLYENLYHFLETLRGERWKEAYLHFEQKVLQEMGFGLKLKACCVTGSVDDLVYVSPKTGRAVSLDAGKAYHDKLLKLPAFLGDVEQKAQTLQDVLNGFALLGYFLEKHMPLSSHKKVAFVRTQLVNILEKQLEKIP